MRETYTEYTFDEPFIRTYMMPAVVSISDEYNKQNTNLNNKFVNEAEGFLKGNMEAGTYVPYRNMTYIRPNLITDRQKDLYKLQQVSFAAHDANLYLDTHPEDVNMIRLYNSYLNEEKKLTDIYERKYGPIDLYDSDGLNMTPWAWIKEPWPWTK